MNWLLIVMIVFLLVMAIIGWRKGFSQALLSLASIVLSVFLAWSVSPVVKNIIVDKTEWETTLATSLSDKFLSEATTQEELEAYFKKMPLPAQIQQNIQVTISNETGIEAQKAAVSGMVADWILTLAVDLALFAILSIVLTIIGKLLSKLIKNSPLRAVDGLLGAVLSLAEAVLILDAILLLIPLLSTTSIGTALTEQIQSSKLMTWIYDHNLISMLASTFLHINL